MKRSVAVIGPTPQFLRWSIDYDCAARQQQQTQAPDATFRQLRGIREFSIAQSQDRVFETFCLHSQATSDAPDSALGFAQHEVLDVFGGAAAIDTQCRDCPANTNAGDAANALWAGCYGFVAADGSSLKLDGEQEQRTGEGQAEHDAPLLVREVDHAIAMLNLSTLVAGNFPTTRPAWYGFFQADTLTVPQLLLLEKIFSAALRRHETQAYREFVDDLLRFIDALMLAHRHSLAMRVDLVPRGFSDGQAWTLHDHCSQCHYSTDEATASWQACPACGKTGAASRGRKFKVLGLRPYVKLAQVIGRDATSELLQRYESQRASL